MKFSVLGWDFPYQSLVSILVVVVVKYHDERQLKEEFILASSSGGLLSMMAGRVWRRQQKAERSYLTIHQKQAEHIENRTRL